MSLRLKQLAAKALASTGGFRLLSSMRQLRGSTLLLLGYHRILPVRDDGSHAGDVELVSATPGEFEWQMRYLAARFEAVSFAQIADALEGGPALPKRAVAVTFDDGFSDLYEHAFPVLQRTGMLATIFVTTDPVDQGGSFWFDQVAWIILNEPRSIAVLPRPLQQHAGDSRDRKRTLVAALSWLKTCEESQRSSFVEQLRAEFPLPVEAGLGRALDWEQIREMSAGGIEFGSHTASHRCLAKLPVDELRHELFESRRRLELELAKPVSALAYPFGGSAAFSQTVIDVARSAGYRVATTYIPGVNVLHSADPFALRRQHVERYTSRAYFEALVCAPEVFD